MAACWAPRLAWVREGWSGRQLAIAIEASTLGQRFVVLALSVVYRGGAVPVAWKLLRATEQPPWHPEWLALLKQFRDRVPTGWTVIVLADRGWYAKRLFQAIVTLGGHPLPGINQPGPVRPQGGYHGVPFTTLVPAVGRRRQGRGTAFPDQKTQLDCTLLGCWSAGYQEAGLVLTGVSAPAAQVCGYGLRTTWIEPGFKRIKRGGWPWQDTRMDDPARAERLWWAIALAPWWLLSVGGEAEATVPAATWPPVPGVARQQGRRWRLVGILRQGWNLLMVALLNQQPLPLGNGCPEPWPELPLLENNELTDPKILSEENLHL